MLFLFRVDSSYEIGSGHVMRCITLANILSAKGNKIIFICKEHDSNLINRIKDLGYEVGRLALSKDNNSSELAHYSWLGGSQDDDVKKTINFIKPYEIDWVVIDHYAIDYYWHKKIRPYTKNILVIDDLADRKHDCDLLLDQNLGSTAEKYKHLVPEKCKLMLGTKYALLRPEFVKWRDISINRRKNQIGIKNILVTLGGVDSQNITAGVLKVLSNIPHIKDAVVNVILGSQSKHIDNVQLEAKKSSLNITIHVNTNKVAELISQADIAIGAGGISAWERCVLGVPAIVFALAENQIFVVNQLQKKGISIFINSLDELTKAINKITNNLSLFSENSSNIIDGLGASRLLDYLTPNDYEILINGKKLTAKNFTKLSETKLLDILMVRNHPEIRKAMFSCKKISQSEHLSFVEKLHIDKSKQFFAIYQSDNLVGVIYFTNIDWDLHKATFGIYSNLFSKIKYAGNILMTAAEYICYRTGINNLTLQVAKNNLKAINLYDNWGFIKVESFEKHDRSFFSYKKVLP